jgi:hypothetical protein
VESYKLEPQNKQPEEPGLELARIRWSAAEAQLKLAANAASPAQDEIDLRFRLAARTARPTTVNVGIVLGESNDARLHGITNLLREIDNVSGYQSRYRGQVNLEDGANGSDLIYLAAPVASEAALTTLASHLGRGGALLADACSATAAEDAKSFQQMAERMGLRLKPLAADDPLLNTRYPFAEPPEGAGKGNVVSNGRFVLSQRDYCCAWSGACEKTALARETVRAALEWGVNLAIASTQPPARGT